MHCFRRAFPVATAFCSRCRIQPSLWPLFFGAAKIGAVAVPVNPFARASDYIHYLENSEPRAAIIHSEALAEFLPAASVRPQIPIVVVGDEKIGLHDVACAKWGAWTAAAAERLVA